MADYRLYYWPLPFRGQFVRAVLAYAGRSWSEGDVETMAKLMRGPIGDMPVPFMGPPVLIDREANVTISQMPAILFYLGETLGLMPETRALRALTIKVLNDANDVIDDLTLDGGRLMWTAPRWRAFVPRLKKWMSLFEEMGRRHGLEASAGHLLGGAAPGLADIVTATLWGAMTERFPVIGAMLEETAPRVAGLTRRINKLSPLAELAAKARRDYGDVYCGGRIEASLRKVLTS